MQEFANNLSPKIVEEENGECVKNCDLTFIRLDIFGELIAKNSLLTIGLIGDSIFVVTDVVCLTDIHNNKMLPIRLCAIYLLLYFHLVISWFDGENEIFQVSAIEREFVDLTFESYFLALLTRHGVCPIVVVR